jgi:hypothetical protein
MTRRPVKLCLENKHCLLHSMVVSGTHHINVSTPPFMTALSAQTIADYLHDLAYGDLWQRIKREFLDWDHMQEEAFEVMGNDLRGAYFAWE